jgi:hypothetical protein
MREEKIPSNGMIVVLSAICLVLGACAGLSESGQDVVDGVVDALEKSDDAAPGADDAGQDAARDIDDAAQLPDSAPDVATDASEIPAHAEILEALGAKGVEGADPSTVAGYAQTFGFLDKNGDSIVTLEEYIASGHFGEEQATAIFNATDRNQDGEVTEDEYVENRIITDEAKLIFEGLDTNGDGNLEEAEFVENTPFAPDVAAAIYALFDINGDKVLKVPEYLRVWGTWARGESTPTGGPP